MPAVAVPPGFRLARIAIGGGEGARAVPCTGSPGNDEDHVRQAAAGRVAHREDDAGPGGALRREEHDEELRAPGSPGFRWRSTIAPGLAARREALRSEPLRPDGRYARA